MTRLRILSLEVSPPLNMDSRSTFRWEDTDELTLGASPVALAVEREHVTTRIGSGTPFQVQEPTIVWAECWPEEEEEEIIGTTSLVASENVLQFGQYRGKSFKWLLENDPGYVVMVLAGHQKERESGDLSDTALVTNKDAFLRYASFYPEAAKAIRQRSTLADDCLVGFGAHKMCT
ncbi:hypothetical protein NFI96_001441 [Prochilodus magdalenae]|nr:hypothetical protein NFI96_001441 [Prochilodus magdalenae]